MSSYVRKAASATLTPISTSIGMVRNAYDFLTTSSSDAKDYVKKTVEYLKDGGAAEISGNTLLAAGIGPKLLDVAKTPELEKLTSSMLDVLKDLLSILQSEEVTKITTNSLWLIKSKPVVDLVSHITGLTLEGLKLMQTKEMSGVRLQLETLINSILGEYVKQKTDKSSAASSDTWVTILQFIEKLQQYNQLTIQEAIRCRRLARKQNFELLILYNAYGVSEYNAIMLADGKNIYEGTCDTTPSQPQTQSQTQSQSQSQSQFQSKPTTSTPIKSHPRSNSHSHSQSHDDFTIATREPPVNTQFHHHHGHYATYNPQHHSYLEQPDHQRSHTSYYGQIPTHDYAKYADEDFDYQYTSSPIHDELPSHVSFVDGQGQGQAHAGQASAGQAPPCASTFVRYVREMLSEPDAP